MDLLKASSIDTNRIWKAAGKPRHGHIFEKRQSARLLYRKKIRENQKLTRTHYSNNLHDAYLRKMVKNSGIAGTLNLLLTLKMLKWMLC